MQIKGRVYKVLPTRSGVSERTGNEWKTLPFIVEYFETPEQRYADRVLVETFDTNVMDKIKEGVNVHIRIGHSIREYNGKTYNEVRLFHVEVEGVSTPENTDTNVSSQADDLPY